MSIIAVVNGPGASQTDIGLTGGGKDIVCDLNGIQQNKISNKEIISKIVELVEKAAELENET